MSKRKARTRKLVPELWSQLGNGDLFAVGITFVGVLNVDHWDNRQSVRRKAKAGEGWGSGVLLEKGGWKVYSRAKRWAATEKAPDQVRSARSEYASSTKRTLLDMVERVILIFY